MGFRLGMGQVPSARQIVARCNDCSSCPEKQGGCVWCESTQECYSSSVYTGQYQFAVQWPQQTGAGRVRHKNYYGDPINGGQCFNAVYTVSNCSAGSCYPPRKCNANNQCFCEDGYSGINCLPATRCSTRRSTTSGNSIRGTIRGCTVTVDSTPEAKMPQGRYFHGADIQHSKQNLYIYGGLAGLAKGDSSIADTTLNDFWKFNLVNQRWQEIVPVSVVRPPRLAGHTLTLVKDNDHDVLILIGGFSPQNGLSHMTYKFNLTTAEWTVLSTLGSAPVGIYGHSTTIGHGCRISCMSIIMARMRGTRISAVVFGSRLSLDQHRHAAMDVLECAAIVPARRGQRNDHVPFALRA